MTLEIKNIFIEDIKFGPQTCIQSKALVINQESLSDFFLQQDDRIKKIHVSLAKPGEATRIICVKDVIEPWCKIRGESPGEGCRHVLKNVAVVTCGKIVGFQEGIIDMNGPGAQYTPFSKTLNIILEIEVVPGLTPHEHEEVVRNTGQAAAVFIGDTGRTETPDELELFDESTPSAISPELPRIAYVYMLLSQGLLHDAYVFGCNAREGLPRTITPQELLDGAITSGNCVSACDKNTTWHHQNNPILRELLKQHGKELNLIGVVLTNEPVRLAEKQSSAEEAIQMVVDLQAEGAIISKEGFGNPDADQMILIRGLEQRGIKTVSITDEYAGPDGFSQSLADATPEADAVVSAGNANERITLPPMARTIGPIKDLTSLAGAYPQSLKDDGSLEIELQGIVGSTNQLGMNTLRCREE